MHRCFRWDCRWDGDGFDDEGITFWPKHGWSMGLLKAGVTQYQEPFECVFNVIRNAPRPWDCFSRSTSIF